MTSKTWTIYSRMPEMLYEPFCKSNHDTVRGVAGRMTHRRGVACLHGPGVAEAGGVDAHGDLDGGGDLHLVGGAAVKQGNPCKNRHLPTCCLARHVGSLDANCAFRFVEEVERTSHLAGHSRRITRRGANASENRVTV